MDDIAPYAAGRHGKRARIGNEPAPAANCGDLKIGRWGDDKVGSQVDRRHRIAFLGGVYPNRGAEGGHRAGGRDGRDGRTADRHILSVAPVLAFVIFKLL